MNCQHCNSDADVIAEYDGVEVGLCERHMVELLTGEQ